MIDESFLIPIPRTEAPLDAPALGWGIIGPGRIAFAFAESHHQCVMLALEAGKHVLVGKPFAINAQQAMYPEG
jgi:hypothetical protein